jgi:hypothetical protein
MPASNTPECFTEFIGQRFVGVLHGALPRGNQEVAAGTKALIFEDGRALVFYSTGAYAVYSKEEVDWAVAATRRRIEASQAELAGVLALAGRPA